MTTHTPHASSHTPQRGLAPFVVRTMTQVRATLGVHLQPELERFVGMACQACFREGYARGLALGEHYRQQAVALKAELANAQPSRIGHDHP